jgi:tetratricopeptide (TPR) repeat protein
MDRKALSLCAAAATCSLGALLIAGCGTDSTSTPSSARKETRHTAAPSSVVVSPAKDFLTTDARRAPTSDIGQPPVAVAQADTVASQPIVVNDSSATQPLDPWAASTPMVSEATPVEAEAETVEVMPEATEASVTADAPSESIADAETIEPTPAGATESEFKFATSDTQATQDDSAEKTISLDVGPGSKKAKTTPIVRTQRPAGAKSGLMPLLVTPRQAPQAALSQKDAPPAEEIVEPEPVAAPKKQEPTLAKVPSAVEVVEEAPQVVAIPTAIQVPSAKLVPSAKEKEPKPAAPTPAVVKSEPKAIEVVDVAPVARKLAAAPVVEPAPVREPAPVVEAAPLVAKKSAEQIAAKPEPIAAKSEPIAAKPEPSVAQPEAVAQAEPAVEPAPAATIKLIPTPAEVPAPKVEVAAAPAAVPTPAAAHAPVAVAKAEPVAKAAPVTPVPVAVAAPVASEPVAVAAPAVNQAPQANVPKATTPIVAATPAPAPAAITPAPVAAALPEPAAPVEAVAAAPAPAATTVPPSLPQATLPQVAAVRSPAMVATLARADERVRHAIQLAEKGAMYASRKEFTAAISAIAQAHDVEHSTRQYSQAAAAGFQALKEAGEFNAPGEVDVRRLVSGHKTPVLKQYDVSDLPPTLAAQHYYNYAKEQLALGVGRETVGSIALYGLAKIVIAGAGANAQQLEYTGPAMALYQAALICEPQNFRAAHELGVLLAGSGQLELAREMLMGSVASSPQPVMLKNLAVVHSRLGDQQAAADAKQKADVLTQTSPSSNTPAVQWVDPATFATMGAGADPANPPTATANPQGTVPGGSAPTKTPANVARKRSTEWNPLNLRR